MEAILETNKDTDLKFTTDSSACVQTLILKLQEIETVMAHPMGVEDTLTRFYVFPILSAMMHFADSEHKLAIDIAPSKVGVQFKIVKNSLKYRRNPVVRVFTVKKEGLGIARDVLYNRLSNVESDSKEKEKTALTVITDATTWIFVRYSGKFVEETEVVVKNSADQHGLKSVLDLLANFVKPFAVSTVSSS